MSETGGELPQAPEQSRTGWDKKPISRRESLQRGSDAAKKFGALVVISQLARTGHGSQPETTPDTTTQIELEEGTKKAGDEFFVVMPGMEGSGEDLTYLRSLMDNKYGVENNFVFSSISEEHAYAQKELQGGYYRKMAEKIAKAAGRKKITIVGHSLGGIEMLSLSQELLKTDWKGSDLELEFYVTPGLGVTGLLSLVDMGMRVADMSKHFGKIDQHILYPLPEGYYKGKEIHIPQGYTLVEDTEIAREERRKQFVSLTTKYPELFTEGEPNDILQQIDKISSKIIDPLNTEPIEQLLRKRGDLLRPVLDALAAGKNIDSYTHRTMLERYGEDTKSLTPTLSAYANLLGSIGEIVKNQAQGVDGTIAEIVRGAERRGVKVAVDLVLAENDLALTTKDVDILQGRLGSRGLGEIIKTILFLQNEGHTTFGYTRVVPDKVLNRTTS